MLIGSLPLQAPPGGAPGGGGGATTTGTGVRNTAVSDHGPMAVASVARTCQNSCCPAGSSTGAGNLGGLGPSLNCQAATLFVKLSLWANSITYVTGPGFPTRGALLNENSGF